MEKFSSFSELVCNNFAEWFENLDFSTQVGLWNEYCEDTQDYENRIYEMYELDELFCECKPTELLDKLGKDFKSSDNYFKYDIYGLESFDYPDDVIEVSDLEDWFERNGENLDDDFGFADWCEENEFEVGEDDEDDDEDDDE